MDTNEISVKRRFVRSGIRNELTDLSTGEVQGASIIHTVEERDDAEFVKVFAAGVAAAYDLSKPGQRVFQAVLIEYENTPMSKGFAESVELYWFGDGLAGRDIGMSSATFNRGMRELLGKRFIYPRSPSSYWVNPSLFFKGNRVLFVKEYVRKRTTAQAKLKPKSDQGDLGFDEAKEPD